ncbi:MAG: hypothetical protein JOZ57_03775, partial [Abitibacteriaceae bacterium]|nr:hypothetical protein [Abditibacteriaceae bacterium]
MKRLPFLSLTLTLILLIVTTAIAHPATRIAGQVTNATHNAPATGAPVQLFRPNGKGQPWTLIKATKVGGNGRFDFGPLELAADDLLIARVEWQGYPYEVPAYDGAGRLKQLDPDISIHPADLILQVFDSTTQPPPLTSKWHQVAIEAKDRDLKCSERVVIENPSRQTFLGEGPQHITVRLHLPAGAHDVELDPEIKDATLTHTGDTVEIAKPITPAAYNNENSISFSYVMSWPLSLPWNRALDLSRKIDYPTRFFFVARAEGDRSLKVIAPQLGADRTISLP